MTTNIQNWPISVADLRQALHYDATQGDEAELTLYVTAACEEVDRVTGRNHDILRYLIPLADDADENDPRRLPAVFFLAARATAKSWWESDKNGPNEVEAIGGDLPARVAEWLKAYPPQPGIG